jgi:hypothetical protein
MDTGNESAPADGGSDRGAAELGERLQDKHTTGIVARWQVVRAASKDASLSRADLAVLIAVAERINRETGMTWGRLETFAADAELSRRQTARSIGRLAERGFLEVQQGRGGKANAYRLSANLGTKRSDSLGTMTVPTLALSAVPTLAPLPASVIPTSVVPEEEHAPRAAPANAESLSADLGAKKPKSARRKKQKITFTEWLGSIPEGDHPIPENHASLRYAYDEIGLPDDLLELAWIEFERQHTSPGSKSACKRQTDWAKTFENYLRNPSWLGLWWLGPEGYALTTKGRQLAIEVGQQHLVNSFAHPSHARREIR